LRLGHGVIFNCDNNGKLLKKTRNDTFDILMGVRATPSKDYAGHSWIQLEYARLFGENRKERITNFAKHSLAWLRYKFSGENQGPFGSSFYTETGIPYLLKMGKDVRSSSDENEKRKKVYEEAATDGHYDLSFMLKKKGGRRRSRRNKRKNRKRTRKRRPMKRKSRKKKSRKRKSRKRR